MDGWMEDAMIDSLMSDGPGKISGICGHQFVFLLV